MIALVTNFNSFGLLQDARVLEDLSPATVRIQHHESTRERFDAIIHLETIGVEVLANAKRNIFVPNPEYCNDEVFSIAHSDIIDEIWCKTPHTHELFKSDKATYTGWVVPDVYEKSVPRHPTFLHMSNKATYRGADELIEAWRSLRYSLTVVGSELKHKSRGNVSVVKSLNDEQRWLALNQNMFYCSFGYEGFGYAIREAAMCGAQVLTVDEPSTRDLGQFLIPAAAKMKIGQVELPKVDPRDIAMMVEHMVHHRMPSMRDKVLKGNAEARRTLSRLLS